MDIGHASAMINPATSAEKRQDSDVAVRNVCSSITDCPIRNREMPKSCNTATIIAAVKPMENNPTSDGLRKNRDIITLTANWMMNPIYWELMDQNAARRIDIAVAYI